MLSPTTDVAELAKRPSSISTASRMSGSKVCRSRKSRADRCRQIRTSACTAELILWPIPRTHVAKRNRVLRNRRSRSRRGSWRRAAQGAAGHEQNRSSLRHLAARYRWRPRSALAIHWLVSHNGAAARNALLLRFSLESFSASRCSARSAQACWPALRRWMRQMGPIFAAAVLMLLVVWELITSGFALAAPALFSQPGRCFAKPDQRSRALVRQHLAFAASCCSAVTRSASSRA